ncbi:MAG TPA: hypothetical protein VJT75_16125 [Thermoleophilaceae bacterium]|nr:hypothetical protein [Thermoleophilaceae bacterium]
MTLLQAVLRWASTIACVIVAVSFLLFAVEKSQAGAKDQAEKVVGINEPSPDPQNEREREQKHSDIREAIDDANDVLTQPFAGIVEDSSSIWVQRIVTALLALLLYGVLVRILIGYIPARR